MTVRIRSATPADMDEVAHLCWAYRDLLISRADGVVATMIEHYYAEQKYSDMIADLPRIHARPRGDIRIAELDGAVVGCAMYYPINANTCEIKRVFVDASARGTGAGRALMLDGMAQAKGDGYTRMVLDTMVRLTEAIALYEKVGFAPSDPFYEPVPEFLPYLRFYDAAL